MTVHLEAEVPWNSLISEVSKVRTKRLKYFLEEEL